MSKVAVIGNSARALGAICAADLTLAGHEVSFAVFPEQSAQLAEIRKRGGFLVEGDSKHLVSKRTGLATLHAICDKIPEALRDAEVVLIECGMHQLEEKFRAMIRDLPRNAVVHVQSHGYWPAARLMPLLAKAGREDVLVTEAAAPTHAARVNGSVVTAKGLRRGIEMTTVPASRNDEALRRLQALFPHVRAASSVLQTGMENLNLIVHPPMILPNVGLMERAGLDGRRVTCYQECVVPSAGVLGDALDAERAVVCSAYGVKHTSMPAAIDQYYGTSGKNFYEAMQNDVYKSFPDFPPTIWREWAGDDVPYAVVPLVLLAEQAGLKAPLHRACADILGTLLGTDPWNSGPTLADLDLQGTRESVMRRVRGAG
ncbi:MAG: NAD/NADP octopine/nopaline dehydrogenase family protein [Burkholderiales bacterium]